MWKHERTQPRLLDIIGIRTGAPTLNYLLSFSFHHQKSVTLPFRSQSPYRVGSGPLGPPTSPV